MKKKVDPPKQPQGPSVSDSYVRFVDIVFGVVVARGFVSYGAIVLDPLRSEGNLFAFVGLFLLNVIVALSWIGYHMSLRDWPYRTESRRAWVRMGMDLLIVSVYAYILLSLEDLGEGPSTVNLSTYLWGQFLVWGLYWAAGVARGWEWRESKASFSYPLIALALLSLLMYVFYSNQFPARPATLSVLNWLFLILPSILHVCFRYWRHSKYATTH